MCERRAIGGLGAADLGLLVYEPPVLCLIVEGFSAPEGQVEAAAMHQGHLQVLPQLHYPWQQRLQGMHTRTLTLCSYTRSRCATEMDAAL